MTLSPRVVRCSSAACVLVCVALAYGRLADSSAQASEGKLPTAVDTSIADTARANELIQHQPGFFLPNLGQGDHAAKFVHRCGPMTLFAEEGGW